MKALIVCLNIAILFTQIVCSQNVGIGILNPAYARLMVNGNQDGVVTMYGSDRSGISIGANNPEIGFNYYNSSGDKTMKAGYAANIGMDPANGGIYLGNFNGNQSASNFGAIAGYRKVITVTQSGNVGIHTSLPTSALEIYSTTDNASSLPGLRLTVNNSYGLSSWNIFSYDGGVFSRNFIFSLYGTQKASISGLNGSYYAVSDRNCKKEIEYMNDGNMLSKLMQLKPATYLMKEEPESGDKQMGFISQDVELIFPEIVSMISGVKMMNYTGLIPVAIQSIKEQQQQILALKNENEALKANIEELRQMILSKLNN
ncbi:MAG: tail fiber domain-containing protein [Ginsengibacter sp.]